MDLNYLRYSYVLCLPIEDAFDRLLDLEDLADNADMFNGVTLTSDAKQFDEIGKSYFLSAKPSNQTFETILRIERLKKPKEIEISYNYQTIEENGHRIGGGPVPWCSMRCMIDLEQHEQGTLVKSRVVAEGVESRLLTRLFSLTNWFQQRQTVKRVKNHLEDAG